MDFNHYLNTKSQSHVYGCEPGKRNCNRSIKWDVFPSMIFTFQNLNFENHPKRVGFWSNPSKEQEHACSYCRNRMGCGGSALKIVGASQSTRTSCFCWYLHSQRKQSQSREFICMYVCKCGVCVCVCVF